MPTPSDSTKSRYESCLMMPRRITISRSALEKLGRGPEAIQHYQQALKRTQSARRSALARLQAGQ